MLPEPNSEDNESDEFISHDEFEYDQSQFDDNTFQIRFHNLFNLLNDVDYNQIIHETVQVNKIEMLLAILTFTKIFALPSEGTVYLCQMINSFFNTRVIPQTRYLIDKYFYPKGDVEYHAVCSTCKAYIGCFSYNQREIACNVCETLINLKNPSYRDFFAIMDAKNEIKDLIEKNAKYYISVISGENRAGNGYLKDIHDGRYYHNFRQSLNGDDRNNYATLTFNSDGSPVFKSSKCSVWPIQIYLNEVPFNCRNNPITMALWFGRDKPNMTTFLTPFVEHINRYSQQGVPCTIDNQLRYIKVYALCCCVDSVARAPMQGILQYNGFFGCSWCLHPGESVKHGKGYARKYPIPNVNQAEPELRTEERTLTHLGEALHLKSPVCGVKAASPLLNLEKFNIIDGFVPDSMHCVALGIVKQFSEYWFESTRKNYSLSKDEKDLLNDRMQSLKVPSHFARLSRSIEDRKYWKAREWENWCLFYSLPLLYQTALENPRLRPYVQHWEYLVEGFYILMKDSISFEDICLANHNLRQFVALTEYYYSKDAMTYNIHQLTHLAQSVLNWGPLWAHHGYFFESGNGQIIKHIHAAKGVISQICRNISLKEGLRILERRTN